MHKLALMLKTYGGDRDYATRLVESIHKHNRDKLALYVVVPQKELGAFEAFSGEAVSIMAEESISDCLIRDDSVFGIRPGYINQEIIKLAFWERGLCDNYLCLDSDGVFIRDFHLADFMYDDETPYTILVEDKELIVEPEYFKQYWEGRNDFLQIIKKEVGLTDPRTLTCHNFAVFSSKVLRSFKEKYLEINGYTYLDVLRKSPYEFSWYNFWLQKDKTIPIMFREPCMKMFHTKSQHLHYLRRGIKVSDIARGYLGIVVNSNYSRGYGVVEYDDSRAYYARTSLSKKVIRLWWKIVRKIGRSLPENRE